ncbi:SH3 domain-containing protein [Streptantibioticus parmotrematis]|uniref:SH3 domain-containing protein n=1 Tax=Streptantibioticus parmotrematis TaxID=2873249 RepID=UPI0033F73D28
MTSTTLTSSRHRFATLAAAAVALAGALMTASPALAAPPQPYGTVIAEHGVYVHSHPFVGSHRLALLSRGTEVGLHCEVVGEPVDGNKIWYQLREHIGGQLSWVTARWVRNTGRVPACPSSPRLTREETAPVEQNPRQDGPLG